MVLSQQKLGIRLVVTIKCSIELQIPRQLSPKESTIIVLVQDKAAGSSSEKAGFAALELCLNEGPWLTMGIVSVTENAEVFSTQMFYIGPGY